MRKVLITDNYFFHCGVVDIISESHLIGCNFKVNEIKYDKLTIKDCIVLHIGNVNKLSEVYSFLKKNCSSRIIIAGKYYFKKPFILVNNTFFLSADADKPTLTKIIKNKSGIKLKRNITSQEELVVKYIMNGYSCKEISAKLNLSIKTISLHKNKAKTKIGLINNNDYTSFSLMKILFNDYSSSDYSLHNLVFF